MQKTKLFFIPILVISIMAILITASQIYDILDNQKVIDNNISNITGEEADTVNNEKNQIVSIDNIPGFDENGNIITDPDAIGLLVQGRTTNTLGDYYDWYWRDISLTIKPNYFFQLNGDLYYPNLYFNAKYSWESGTSNSELNNPSYTDSSYEGGLNTGSGSLKQQQFILLDYNENVPRDNISSRNIYIKIVNNTYNEIELKLELYVPLGYIVRSQEDTTTVLSFGITGYYSLDIEIPCFMESRNSYSVSYGSNNNKYYALQTNELYNKKTTYEDDPIFSVNANKILGLWSNGKELATLKCSIGEYYEYDVTKDDNKGSLAISTQNNNLPMLFNNGDIVIPYIATANGTEPLSIKSNGRPKMFQVTQIRPYFDGAFWQELQLQEINGKNKTSKAYIFESTYYGSIEQGYSADPQTIVFSDGKIIDVQLSYSLLLFDMSLGGPYVSINEEDNSFTISNVYLRNPNSMATITATITYEA